MSMKFIVKLKTVHTLTQGKLKLTVSLRSEHRLNLTRNPKLVRNSNSSSLLFPVRLRSRRALPYLRVQSWKNFDNALLLQIKLTAYLRGVMLARETSSDMRLTSEPMNMTWLGRALI